MSEPITIEKPVRLQAAAEQLGVSVKTVRRLLSSGQLRAFKIGGQWFTRGSFIQAYIEQQIQKSGGKQPC
jgi:excisionase family DNA binding protein